MQVRTSHIGVAAIPGATGAYQQQAPGTQQHRLPLAAQPGTQQQQHSRRTSQHTQGHAPITSQQMQGYATQQHAPITSQQQQQQQHGARSGNGGVSGAPPLVGHAQQPQQGKAGGGKGKGRGKAKGQAKSTGKKAAGAAGKKAGSGKGKTRPRPRPSSSSSNPGNEGGQWLTP